MNIIVLKIEKYICISCRYVTDIASQNPAATRSFLTDFEYLRRHIPEFIHNLRQYHINVVLAVETAYRLGLAFGKPTFRRNRRSLYRMTLEGGLLNGGDSSQHVFGLLSVLK